MIWCSVNKIKLNDIELKKLKDRWNSSSETNLIQLQALGRTGKLTPGLIIIIIIIIRALVFTNLLMQL